jgi:spore germination protein GerM
METLAALIVGPTTRESAGGITTAVPRGTSVLGLVIDKGQASLNLSSQFKANADTPLLTLRLAQVACTLAKFPSITRLQFAFDGRPASVPVGSGTASGTATNRPVTCADYAGYLTGPSRPAG